MRCLVFGAVCLIAAAITTPSPSAAQSIEDLEALNQRVVELFQAGKYDEAISLAERAVALAEKVHGPDHPKVGIGLSNLAQLLQETNRLAEAEPLMRRALQIDEASLGPDHPNVAADLGNLALLLQENNRLAEAEALMRRALQIDETSLGTDHPNVARDLSNLALLLKENNRLAEAELLMRRALNIDEKSLDPDSPKLATHLRNLALLFQETDRRAEAEPLYRRALQINEKSYGSDHPSVARDLSNLALLFQETDRRAEAEPLYRRALQINEKSYGFDHPSVARDLTNLAGLRSELGYWSEAVELHRRAVLIMTAGGYRWAYLGERYGTASAALKAYSRNLRVAARAFYRANAGKASAGGEAFQIAQWALQTSAADAIAQRVRRFSELVRQRQDLLAKRKGEDKRLLSAVGEGNTDAAAAIRQAIGEIDAKLDVLDERFAEEYPDYAALTNQKQPDIGFV